MRSTAVRVMWVAVLGGLAACQDPSVAVCERNCDKRDECLGDVDVAQCHTACADSAPVGDADCVEADVAFQACLTSLPCDDYVTAAGCPDERQATVEACASP